MNRQTGTCDFCGRKGLLLKALPYADNAKCLSINFNQDEAALTIPEVRQACAGCIEDRNFEPHAMQYPNEIGD